MLKIYILIAAKLVTSLGMFGSVAFAAYYAATSGKVMESILSVVPIIPMAGLWIVFGNEIEREVRSKKSRPIAPAQVGKSSQHLLPS
jgi:hypothetical protein